VISASERGLSRHTIEMRIHRWPMILAAVIAVSCGGSMPVPEPTSGAPHELVRRQFSWTEPGGDATARGTTEVWIEPGHEGSMNTDDPCCGLSYDGNWTDDRIATCAAEPGEGTECGPGRTTPYWGSLADDPVCGERPRCVPLPEARIILLDATAATSTDSDGVPVPTGADARAVAYGRVSGERDGGTLLQISLEAGGKQRQELVALDFGARYTIFVRAGRIERVSRDG
jgi:hypothetical protein